MLSFEEYCRCEAEKIRSEGFELHDLGIGSSPTAREVAEDQLSNVPSTIEKAV
jgi:hypothetical protein